MVQLVNVVLIGSMLSLAAARPDLSLGYRYNQGHSSGGGGFLAAPSSFSPSSSYSPSASGNSYYNAGQSQSVGSFDSGFVPSTGFTQSTGFSGSGYSGGGGFSSNQVNYQDQQSYAQEAPIITKHFYVHSAPEDHDEQQIVRHINIGPSQKHYRVVFINAPSSSVSRAKIIANVPSVEDKTAIYVLSKKSNSLDISTEVVTPAPILNKPEVFFIKYKTPAEAAYAQQTVQTQYDSLGGTSDISNEGTAPVSSVIGSLGGSSSTSSDTQYSGQQSQSFGHAVNIPQTGDNSQQTYLPPHQRYHK